jgi:uncharacterized protein YukE
VIGHFTLDVDPAGLTAAATRLARAHDGLAHTGDRLHALLPGLAASWHGKAASALSAEGAGLATDLKRTEPYFSEAAAALTELARHYTEARSTTIPYLNRAWEDAEAQHAAALRASAWQHRADTTGIAARVPSGMQQEARSDAAWAATQRETKAHDELATTQADLQRSYGHLVERLQAQTGAAGSRLAGAIVVPVPAAAVDSYNSGTVGRWLTGTFFDESAAWAAFGSSLPLSKLQRDLAHLPTGAAALKAVLDQARAAGVPPTQYALALKAYWIAQAMQDAGIDPATWDPALGADANRATILAVYTYYGKLFLANNDLQWAGMANMIGPSFAGGFFDLDMIQHFAQGFSDLPGPIRDALSGNPALGAGMGALSHLSAKELHFYETTLLSMQKSIFEDQGSMHTAYAAAGGLNNIAEMYAAGLITPETYRAWVNIDSGSAALIREGNEALLHREQFEIIGKDYDDMRNHGVTGEAFTYALTAIGAPSIPGAHTYNEIDPLVLHQDLTPKSFGTPSSIFGVGIPHVSVDDPLHVQVDITTPLPGGNVSDRTDRWTLITQDTLPAYQDLLDTDIERARSIIASDVAGRVDDQRLVHQVDDILLRLVTDWDIGVSR